MSTGGGTHILPVRTYLAVFAALMVLTAVTTWAAYRDWGALETSVAMAIALAKAVLVLAYFMHLKFSSRLTWVFVGAGVIWFIFLIALTLADYDTRPGVPGWENLPAATVGGGG